MAPLSRVRPQPRLVLFTILAALLLTAFPVAASAQSTPDAATDPELPVTITDATGTEVTVTDVSRIIPAQRRHCRDRLDPRVR